MNRKPFDFAEAMPQDSTPIKESCFFCHSTYEPSYLWLVKERTEEQSLRWNVLAHASCLASYLVKMYRNVTFTDVAE